MADHHDLEAMQVEPGSLDQLDRGGRGAGHQRQLVVDDVADGRGVHALDVLQRMDRGRQRTAVNMFGHRTLQNNAEHILIVIHGDDACFALVLGERAGPARVLEAEADFRSGARLRAHVDGGLFLLTDVDRDETSDLMCRRRRAHARRHVGENTVADGPAVQEPIVCHGHQMLARAAAGCKSSAQSLRLYRPEFPGGIAVLPGGGCVAAPVPGPQMSMPSELFPLVPSGAIGPTSVNGRPDGNAGGFLGSIVMLVPRMAAIISFCTTRAAMFRSKVGGLISPQSWCAMAKYNVLPTMVMSSMDAVVRGLSQRPQTTPRSRLPTRRKVKICLSIPSGPNPTAIHVPTMSDGRSALK